MLAGVSAAVAGVGLLLCVPVSGCLASHVNFTVWNDDSHDATASYDVALQGDVNRVLFNGTVSLKPGEKLVLNHPGRLCDENGRLVVGLELGNGTHVERERAYSKGGCGPQNVWVHLQSDAVVVYFVFTD